MTHSTTWIWPVSWMLFAILNRVTQAEFSSYGSPISLDEVTELHFHKGRVTTYNRNPPLPQLTCTRGCEFQPDLVICTNIKPKGRRSRWRCDTDLPARLKLDETSIICEGFHSDEDEEVLEGSCALEFTLTHAGWAPYGHSEKMAFDPKMKGWSASWIVMTAVLGYLSFHIYHGVNWIQEFKNLLQRLRRAWIKAKRWLRGAVCKTRCFQLVPQKSRAAGLMLNAKGTETALPTTDHIVRIIAQICLDISKCISFQHDVQSNCVSTCMHE